MLALLKLGARWPWVRSVLAERGCWRGPCSPDGWAGLMQLCPARRAGRRGSLLLAAAGPAGVADGAPMMGGGDRAPWMRAGPLAPAGPGPRRRGGPHQGLAQPGRAGEPWQVQPRCLRAISRPWSPRAATRARSCSRPGRSARRRRAGRHRPAPEGGGDAAHQPGAPQGAPAHHHPVGAGDRQATQGVLRAGDVAVGDQWNPQRRLHPADRRPVGPAGEALLPGATVKGEQRAPASCRASGKPTGSALARTSPAASSPSPGSSPPRPPPPRCAGPDRAGAADRCRRPCGRSCEPGSPC